MAGVAVEASSPALIERARQAVTDDGGRYRIEDLRPGTYTVTFVRAGWRTVVRTGVELTGSSTATVDAQLAAGSLDEAVTVVGALPTVDVYSPNRETTLSQEVVTAIPTVRSYNALLVVVPGVVTSVNDTVSGTATTSFPIHGGRTTEGRLMVDGLTVGSPRVVKFRDELRDRRRRGAGNYFLGRGGIGRGRDRRARDERRAAERRQHDCWFRHTRAEPVKDFSPTISARS